MRPTTAANRDRDCRLYLYVSTPDPEFPTATECPGLVHEEQVPLDWMPTREELLERAQQLARHYNLPRLPRSTDDNLQYTIQVGCWHDRCGKRSDVLEFNSTTGLARTLEPLSWFCRRTGQWEKA